MVHSLPLGSIERFAWLVGHCWALSADVWDGQMMALGSAGYRVVAHDRRSHGRWDQTWDNNTMDQYVSDYAELLEHLT